MQIKDIEFLPGFGAASAVVPVNWSPFIHDDVPDKAGDSSPSTGSRVYSAGAGSPFPEPDTL